MKFDKVFFVRFLFAFFGDAILALGAALLIKANLGVDTFTAENLGSSAHLNMSLGLWQMLFSIVVGLVIFFLKRDLLGVGSIINILFTGYFIDFFVFVLRGIEIDIIVWQIALMLAALLIYSLGISLYSTAGLGAGPYDALAMLIEHFTQWKFIHCRILLDSSFLVLGLILGGPIGIATILAAFLLGPMINFYNKTITDPALRKLGAK